MHYRALTVKHYLALSIRVVHLCPVTDAEARTLPQVLQVKSLAGRPGLRGGVMRSPRGSFGRCQER